jgi:hypothetical protein
VGKSDFLHENNNKNNKNNKNNHNFSKNNGNTTGPLKLLQGYSSQDDDGNNIGIFRRANMENDRKKRAELNMKKEKEKIDAKYRNDEPIFDINIVDNSNNNNNGYGYIDNRFVQIDDDADDDDDSDDGFIGEEVSFFADPDDTPLNFDDDKDAFVNPLYLDVYDDDGAD